MEERPGLGRVATTLISIACMAAIFVMVPLAMLQLLDVGGFCASGGPYVIRQECPDGVMPVLGAGFPLLFVFGIAYTVSLPTGWRFLLVWCWPLLFLIIAAAFIVSAFTAPDQGFAAVPFIVGIVMAAIGIGPMLIGLPILPSPRRAANRGEPSAKGSLALQLVFVALGGVGGYFLWGTLV